MRSYVPSEECLCMAGTTSAEYPLSESTAVICDYPRPCVTAFEIESVQSSDRSPNGPLISEQEIILPPTTRREFFKDAGLFSAGLVAGSLMEQHLFAAVRPSPATEGPRAGSTAIALSLLGEESPAISTGVSWGVPWERGRIRPDVSFQLSGQDAQLPLQTWPLAYWPDGSLKWSGFASILPAGLKGPLNLSAVSPVTTTKSASIGITHTDEAVLVNTGVLECAIPLTGPNIIRSLSLAGKTVAGAGQLVCILQDGPQTDPEDSPHREKYLSFVKQVTVEQTGPLRAVIKIDGLHRGVGSRREWLPFSVRLYFYSGQTAVRMVHTIIFDGDAEKDFVRGLGLELEVPMRDAPRNRTVRFAGPDGGLWSEPLQPGGGNIAQETGKPFGDNPVFASNAIWNDFRLIQPNPEGFTIAKRTNAKSAWLFSAAGKRAPGLAYVGDLSGGLALGVKNFWQSYPAGLEIRQASGSAAKLVAWLWAPDGQQMDMRFYDTHGHGLDASYEDVQPGLSTAYGVARTSELTLYPLDEWPTRAETVAMAHAGTQRSLLTCSPEYIHSTGVFGVWSLPDRTTPFKKSIEDGLDSVLAYYQRQVDDRSWYGFWQYGDFMHSYSRPRHAWHDDWGGHAWDNTELAAPLWLWYSYIRSGRADLFRLAEAHARNTSETDVYHLGPMKGLGSRHNVIKWGDGAKEARISQAVHWRFFYYLTTDERTGDIMHMVAESAGIAIGTFDPMREVTPKTPGEPPVRIRIGPDWFALAGNWMTEWERTNNNHWRDLILSGVDSIVAMPYGPETGRPMRNPKAQTATVGFENDTGKLTSIGYPDTKALVPVNYNLATIQGGAEVMFELVPLLGRQDFAKSWLQMCRIGNASADVYARDKITGTEGADASYVVPKQSGPRLAAYAYSQTRNRAFAQKAISMLLAQGGGFAEPRRIIGPDSLNPVEEDASVSTNEAAQTGLSTIEILELCKDQLPSEAIVREPRTMRR